MKSSPVSGTAIHRGPLVQTPTLLLSFPSRAGDVRTHPWEPEEVKDNIIHVYYYYLL